MRLGQTGASGTGGAFWLDLFVLGLVGGLPWMVLLWFALRRGLAPAD